MLNAIILIAIMLNVIILIAIMLNVIILSVVMLSVMAPKNFWLKTENPDPKIIRFYVIKYRTPACRVGVYPSKQGVCYLTT
jgi:hypothetical protein